jgi:CTP:molybdopterin cytidylyltransferase MocA
MIAAVVPAAGRGTRMGRPKLSLCVGGRPMLESVVTALRDGGADPVVVVTGPHDPRAPAIARAAGADVCELAEPSPDMRTTVEHGLRWLLQRYRPGTDDAFLLTPGDIPFLDAGTVRTLCRMWRSQPSASVLVPVRASQRGHPALIGWRHVAAILSWPVECGINSYLREWGDETEMVPVSSAGGFGDVDTPADRDSLGRFADG